MNELVMDSTHTTFLISRRTTFRKGVPRLDRANTKYILSPNYIFIYRSNVGTTYTTNYPYLFHIIELSSEVTSNLLISL